MIESAPAILFDSVPWWIGVSVLYLTVLVAGMALDETYVNRMTPLSAAIALSVHSLLNDGLWMPLSLYVDAGLLVGVYGLYAYVVDAYVGEAFRLAAFLLYSPLSVVLVLLFPEILFFVALGIAGFANMQLLATLHPVEPYYFGPESPTETVTDESEWGTREPIERAEADPGAGLSSAIAGRSVTEILGGAANSDAESTPSSSPPSQDGAVGAGGSGSGSPLTEDPDQSTAGGAESSPPDSSAGPTAESTVDDDSTPDRGVLPSFMRRV